MVAVFSLGGQHGLALYFVRWSGPLGPRLVSGWTSRRFSQLPEEEAQALHDYSYALFRQRGSSSMRFPICSPLALSLAAQ